MQHYLKPTSSNVTWEWLWWPHRVAAQLCIEENAQTDEYHFLLSQRRGVGFPKSDIHQFVCIVYCCIHECNFTAACIKDTNASSSCFSKCKALNCLFRSVNLTNAQFESCSFARSCFKNCALRSTKLKNTSLAKTLLKDCTLYPEHSILFSDDKGRGTAEYKNCDLSDSSLLQCNFEENGNQTVFRDVAVNGALFTNVRGEVYRPATSRQQKNVQWKRLKVRYVYVTWLQNITSCCASRFAGYRKLEELFFIQLGRRVEVLLYRRHQHQIIRKLLVALDGKNDIVK